MVQFCSEAYPKKKKVWPIPQHVDNLCQTCTENKIDEPFFLGKLSSKIKTILPKNDLFLRVMKNKEANTHYQRDLFFKTSSDRNINFYETILLKRLSNQNSCMSPPKKINALLSKMKPNEGLKPKQMSKISNRVFCPIEKANDLQLQLNIDKGMCNNFFSFQNTYLKENNVSKQYQWSKKIINNGESKFYSPNNIECHSVISVLTDKVKVLNMTTDISIQRKINQDIDNFKLKKAKFLKTMHKDRIVFRK
jgi:hypothetical protein